MGWHGADLYVHTTDDGLAGWRRGSTPLSHAEQADVAISRSGEWLVVHYHWETGPELEDGPWTALPTAGRLIATRYSSVSDVYTFELLDGGRPVRSFVWSERELVEQEGAPLAEEAGLDWPEQPEDELFTLVDRLTGVPEPAHHDLTWYPLLA
ncbi:MAG TPA: hypothetical protein VFR07_10935 [Mycobacteriales bacterium]|jgi:hypothetical protein|nr:hypothetical protein [Mycobacteriales bacterium]